MRRIEPKGYRQDENIIYHKDQFVWRGVEQVTDELLPAWQDPPLLDELASYLDKPGDNKGVWRAIMFMEEHGLDLALRQGELHAYLSDENSPLKPWLPIDIEAERQIVIGLRELARRRLGLAPLSEEEKSAWEYQAFEPRHVRPGQSRPKTLANTFRPTPLQLEYVRGQLLLKAPRLYDAVDKICAYNKSHPTDQIALFGMLSQLRVVVRSIYPDMDGVDVHNVIGDLITSWPDN